MEEKKKCFICHNANVFIEDAIILDNKKHFLWDYCSPGLFPLCYKCLRYARYSYRVTEKSAKLSWKKYPFGYDENEKSDSLFFWDPPKKIWGAYTPPHYKYNKELNLVIHEFLFYSRVRPSFPLHIRPFYYNSDFVALPIVVKNDMVPLISYLRRLFFNWPLSIAPSLHDFFKTTTFKSKFIWRQTAGDDHKDNCEWTENIHPRPCRPIFNKDAKRAKPSKFYPKPPKWIKDPRCPFTDIGCKWSGKELVEEITFPKEGWSHLDNVNPSRKCARKLNYADVLLAHYPPTVEKYKFSPVTRKIKYFKIPESPIQIKPAIPDREQLIKHWGAQLGGGFIDRLIDYQLSSVFPHVGFQEVNSVEEKKKKKKKKRIIIQTYQRGKIDGEIVYRDFTEDAELDPDPTFEDVGLNENRNPGFSEDGKEEKERGIEQQEIRLWYTTPINESLPSINIYEDILIETIDQSRFIGNSNRELASLYMLDYGCSQGETADKLRLSQPTISRMGIKTYDTPIDDAGIWGDKKEQNIDTDIDEDEKELKKLLKAEEEQWGGKKKTKELPFKPGTYYPFFHPIFLREKLNMLLRRPQSRYRYPLRADPLGIQKYLPDTWPHESFLELTENIKRENGIKIIYSKHPEPLFEGGKIEVKWAQNFFMRDCRQLLKTLSLLANGNTPDKEWAKMAYPVALSNSLTFCLDRDSIDIHIRRAWKKNMRLFSAFIHWRSQQEEKELGDDSKDTENLMVIEKWNDSDLNWKFEDREEWLEEEKLLGKEELRDILGFIRKSSREKKRVLEEKPQQCILSIDQSCIGKLNKQNLIECSRCNLWIKERERLELLWTKDGSLPQYKRGWPQRRDIFLGLAILRFLEHPTDLFRYIRQLAEIKPYFDMIIRHATWNYVKKQKLDKYFQENSTLT